MKITGHDYLVRIFLVNFFLLVTVLLIFLGCSSNHVNRDIYKALIQRECIQKTGVPNCDSGQPGYEDYQREREEIKNQE